MHISGAMFEVLLQCFQKYSSDISFLIYKIQNVNISKTKKDFPKRKMPFFFILESLSNKQQLFSYHRHFNKYSYLKMEHHSSLPRPHLLRLKTHYFVHSWKKGRTISPHVHTIKKVHVYNSQKSYCIHFFHIIKRNSLLHTWILHGLVRQCFLPDTSGARQKVFKPWPYLKMKQKKLIPCFKAQTENNGI